MKQQVLTSEIKTKFKIRLNLNILVIITQIRLIIA